MAAIEIAVESVEAAVAAQAGGAHRIELCSALSEGGLTPSLGLLRSVRARVTLPIHVLIRPRSGDFLYSEPEMEIMLTDIQMAAQEGADGVVLGVLTPEGDVDVDRTGTLIRSARGMSSTFHRALDLARDPETALEDVIRCGANRVLTSGASHTAWDGRDLLRRLHQRAGERIAVMAGGGVRSANVAALARHTGIFEFHASLRREMPARMRFQRHIGLGPAGAIDSARTAVLASDVREFAEAAAATRF